MVATTGGIHFPHDHPLLAVLMIVVVVGFGAYLSYAKYR
jgi:hypothetical protein